MFDLSVCMIVKNEEKVLNRCLECVSKFADEIIIVDTGSTDKTKEIALDFTDKVYDFVWCDDFSKARNYSLSLATCNYIMWLDADDVIQTSEIKKIITLKQTTAFADFYMLKYNICFDSNNKCTFSFYRERIFKNDKTNFFQGFVHEAVAPKGNIQYLDISIEHRKINITNPKRNLNIYRKQIKNGHKLCERELFYYSRELYYNGFYKSAITNFKRFLKMPKKLLANTVDAYLMLANCYTALNDLNKAKNIILQSFAHISPNAEICCLLGNLFEKEHKTYQAIHWYKAATICEKKLEDGYFVQEQFYDLIPYIQLTYLYYNIDRQKSKYYHTLAKSIAPQNEMVLYNEKFF